MEKSVKWVEEGEGEDGEVIPPEEMERLVQWQRELMALAGLVRDETCPF